MRDDRESQVTLQGAGEPFDIADRQGLIEAQSMSAFRDPFGRLLSQNAGIDAGREGVAGRKRKGGESDDRDAEQNRYGDQQPVQKVTKHAQCPRDARGDRPLVTCRR